MEELVNHPVLVKFRTLILEDRFKESLKKSKQVTSKSHAEKFGFLSNAYFNAIQNGKTAPSLETFLYMIDKMGYEIEFKNKETNI